MFEILEILQDPVYFYSLIVVLGLMVGSFLNVLIYRLPIMLERNWYQQSIQFLLELKNQGREDLSRYDASDQTVEIMVQTRPQAEIQPSFNLCTPASHCPQCGAKIRFWQNIPVLSYVFLRGHCANCDAVIPLRYPIVELLTALLSLAIAYYFGFSLQTFAGLIFTWILIALTVIDIDTQLLPDDITLFGLWFGLLLSLLYVFVTPQEAIIGAAAGYLSLWLIYWAFKMVTGKEGMGYGDFKLFALAGAWMGWTALPLVILIASASGAIWGICSMLLGLSSRDNPIPFGPFLALGAWLTFVFGDQIIALYLTWAY
jgi:leader peptidase (prepilin peptidase)/N-methyltransferase